MERATSMDPHGVEGGACRFYYSQLVQLNPNRSKHAMIVFWFWLSMAKSSPPESYQAPPHFETTSTSTCNEKTHYLCAIHCESAFINTHSPCLNVVEMDDDGGRGGRCDHDHHPILLSLSSRHISVFASTSSNVWLVRSPPRRWSWSDSLLETWPNIASCSVFSPKRQYFREIGALSIVEVKKGLSSPSFPQPETSHTAAYLASSLPFPSSISFSSSSAAGRRRRRATSVLSAKRNPTPKDTKLA